MENLFELKYSKDGRLVVDISPLKDFVPSIIETADYVLEQQGKELSWDEAKSEFIKEIEEGLDLLKEQLGYLHEPKEWSEVK